MRNCDVRQLQRDAVAGLYPGRGQGRREPVGGLVKLGVGQLAAVVHGDRAVRCRSRRFVEDDSKVEAHGPSRSEYLSGLFPALSDLKVRPG